MTLEAVPPQTPQPTKDPDNKPGPHSPQPDPIPRKVALNDRPFSQHETAPLAFDHLNKVYIPMQTSRMSCGAGFIMTGGSRR